MLFRSRDRDVMVAPVESYGRLVMTVAVDGLAICIVVLRLVTADWLKALKASMRNSALMPFGRRY